MKVALIGVGQAGGKLTERISRYDSEMGFEAVQGTLAVNSAKPDLQSLECVETQLIGAERVNGHGVGGDNELGAEIMQSDVQQVLDKLDGRVTSRSEAIFVIAGLGGGTGSGGAPVLVHHLQRVYDIPVYALGVLPGQNEGALYQANAGRSLKTLAREADSTLLIDNDAWHEQGESVKDAFARINTKISERVGLLFASGEAVEGVGESVVDSSEVINTLRSGGLSVLGYASEVANEDSAQNVQTVMSVTRQAILTGTSLPNATNGDSALLVIAGRPQAISRKGIEKARSWLEEEIGSMQVRGGDFPLESDRLSALVLLGGAERSKRITEFMERAREADQKAKGTDPAETLTDDRLDSLF